MASLEAKMKEILDIFRKDYPQMEFEISQDQTRLLDYSISNLRQSLLAGGILAFLLMFFFLKDGKSPLIIGFSIPATLVISLLFFYLVGSFDKYYFTCRTDPRHRDDDRQLDCCNREYHPMDRQGSYRLPMPA